MGKPVLVNGDRFARVTCIGTEYKMHTIYYDGIEDTCARKFYLFKCDCGNEFEAMVHEWKGKKHTPDCGCGLADQIQGRVNLIVSVPVDMAARARLAARGVTLSQWLRDCINAGIEGRIKK